MSRGLIVGRFMPPHAGHQFLVATAAALVDELTLLLMHEEDDPIPAALRLGWLAELFPRARIIAQPATAGSNQAMRLGSPPVDLLFTASPEDLPFAAAIDAQAILIDPERATVAAASALVRADPQAWWHCLPDVVRPFYARTICLHGPESTGKSTLAPLLARHLGTIFVPEYGRTYCEQHGLDLAMSDLVAIGRTHAAMIAAAKRRCGGRLVLDTDPLMTAAWADMLFGARDPWFDAFEETADLYLLLDADLPWVDDGTRFFGDVARRRRFLDLSRAELDRRGLPYAVIGGTHEERFARAVAVIAAAGL